MIGVKPHIYGKRPPHTPYRMVDIFLSTHLALSGQRPDGIYLQAWLTDVLSSIVDREINWIDALLPWRYAQWS